jgi:hypothetical protein
VVSMTPKKIATATVIAITATVKFEVSCRVGQVTFFTSAQDAWKKPRAEPRVTVPLPAPPVVLAAAGALGRAGLAAVCFATVHLKLLITFDREIHKIVGFKAVEKGKRLAGPAGLEPTTNGFGDRHSTN